MIHGRICKGCSRMQQNKFIKMLPLSSIMCFDVHCENVFDHGNSIKILHKDCKDNICIVARNENNLSLKTPEKKESDT